VVVVCDVEQTQPEQRPPLKIEGTLRFVTRRGQDGFRLIRHQVGLQCDSTDGRDDLNRLPVFGAEARAQDFVPFHDPVERIHQEPAIHPPLHPHGDGRVVGGALRFQLRKKPEPPLPETHRKQVLRRLRSEDIGRPVLRLVVRHQHG